MATSTKVVFWDVQHGHATYIKSPNDRHIVVDLGIGDYSEKNSCFSPLQHIRYEYGVTQLNYVIITHPHLDHIDDILNFVFSLRECDNYTKLQEDTTLQKRIKEFLINGGTIYNGYGVLKI